MQNDNNSRIAKNTLFLYVRMFFALIVTLYTSRIILRVLGVVDFGVYNVVAGFVSMFAFLNTSLTGAIQRYYNFERSTNGNKGVQGVYMSSMIIQVVITVSVIVVLEAFGVWYVNNVMVIPDDRLFAANLLFQVSIVSLALLIMTVPFSSAIVSFECMDYFAIVGIIDVVLKLVIVLVLPLIGGDKLIIYSCLLLCVSILNFFLYFVYAKTKFHALNFKGVVKIGMTKSMLVFSGWNFFGTFSNVVYLQGVNLLLNFFFGPVVNAARGLSNYVSAAVQGFSANIVMAFRPQLVESYAQENFSRTKNIMFSEAKICYLMLLLLITPVIIEIEYILKLWLGNDIPEHTVSFTILILIQLLISSLNTPFSQVVHASGNMKKFQLITGGITCFIIPLGLIALKMGMAAESVFMIAIILSVVSQIACIALVREFFDYGIKSYLRHVIFPLAIASTIIPIIPYIIHVVMETSFERLILVAVATAFILMSYSYFFVLDPIEKGMACSMIKKVIKK